MSRLVKAGAGGWPAIGTGTSPYSVTRPGGSQLIGRAPEADVPGNVWKIEVEVGAQVDEGDVLVILESMKMEMPVEAEVAGSVLELRVQEGQCIREGDTIAVLG